MDIFLIIVALLLLLIGLIGLIHPALPGLPIMFGGVWLLAYIGDYHYISIGTLIAVGVFAIIGMAMDFISGVLGAKATGASSKALWGAFFGGILGIFLGLIGIILGPVLGAAIGEYSDKKDLLKAGTVSLGTFIGLLVGTIAKVGCAFAMISVTIGSYLITILSS